MSDTVDLLLAAINNGAFLLCVAFIGYILLIVVPFVRRARGRPGDGAHFAWHFIIPCLNEQAVVGDTVRRLVLDFPTAHIWCVDDGSTDGTARVLSRVARWSGRVHVVVRKPPNARQGKGPALNAGWQAIRRTMPAGADPERVIVGVLDADGRLDRRCLDVISGKSQFGDPTVGAVQIQVRVVDPAARGRARPGPRGPVSRLLVRLQDVEFTSSIAAMQTLRRHTGSVGMGGNGQFTRLSVLERIAADSGAPWHGALLEDFELGLHVLLAGSRTEYCHDTYVEQEGITSLRSLVRQRSRWAQGSMQCFRYLAPVLRSRRISNTGAVEIAYFLLLPWLQVVGAVLYLASAVVLTWFVFTTPGGPSAWYDFGGWGVLPLFMLFGLIPLAMWGFVYRRTTAPGMTRRRAAVLGLANWPYTLVHYVASWWAFVRVVRGHHDWKKTERHPHGATADREPLPSRPMRPPLPAGDRPHRPPAALASHPVGSGRAPSVDDWDNAVVRYVGGRRPRASGLGATLPVVDHTVGGRAGRPRAGPQRSTGTASSPTTKRALTTTGAVRAPVVHSQQRLEEK